MGMTIIKNYRIPRNCYDCDIHNYHECSLTSESIEEDYCWNGNSREKHCPLREVEAIPKDQYEARLKADVVAMLEKLKSEIILQVIDEPTENGTIAEMASFNSGIVGSYDLIQQKINALRGEENDGKNNT